MSTVKRWAPGRSTPGGDVVVGRQALLVARDPSVVEPCLAAAAAAGATVEVVRDPARVRAQWRSAPCVLVGVEMAALVAGIALEPRPGVHLVGGRLDELASWSAPLQASVVLLPEQTGTLTQVLEQGGERPGDAVVVRLVGGSGGLGTSTLACALGVQAARHGIRAAVVEADPTGGGLDVVLGAEDEPGWRWPDLRSAAGHVDALSGRLPRVADVDVVAQGRGTRGGAVPAPSPEAVRAVMGSLCRSHELVVVDAGTSDAPLLDAWPGQRHVVLCSADVRGVVAARSRVQAAGLHDVELVVRTGAGRRIAPELVAEHLGIPLLGSIGDDRRVTRAAESGVPVGQGRRGYAHEVSRLVEALCAPAQVAA